MISPYIATVNIFLQLEGNLRYQGILQDDAKKLSDLLDTASSLGSS